MAETIDSLAIEITSNVSDIVSRLKSLSSGLSGASSAAKGASTGMKELNTETKKTGKTIVEASGEARTFGDKLKDLESTASGTSKKLSGLTSAANGVKSAFSSFTSIPRYFGGELVGNITNATSALTGFMSKMGNVAVYRIARTAMKEVTKAIKEGITNLYHWSETFNGTFYQSMNTIATEAQYLKNSLGAMFQPLIEYITPFVTYITDKLVGIINLVNQFISALTGKSTYTAAKKVAAVWDDSSKKTTDSAKKVSNSAKSISKSAKSTSKSVKETANEFKRFLLGFDELNILGKNVSAAAGINTPITGTTTPTTGTTTPTTGTTTPTTGTDYSKMFETKNIDSQIKAFVDKIKALVNLQKWEAIGTLIGNKINDIVNSIDFAKYGRKIGEKINAWFSIKYWTLDTINFTNIGSKIAEFLNNAISEINFNTVGRTMVQKMTIIGDLAIGFFTGFDWAQGADAFSQFTKGIYQEITKWLKKYTWTDIGTSIADKLFDAITHIDFYGIAKNFFLMMDAAFNAALGILTGFFSGIADRIKGYIKWDTLTEETKKQLTTLAYVVSGASLAIGAILTFSGINIAAGIGLMAAGLGIAAVTYSMNDDLKNAIEEKLNGIKGALYTAELVVGAILLFTWANPALGLGLLVHGAFGMGNMISENFETLQFKMEGWIGTLTEVISKAFLVLGLVSLVAGQYAIGIGLLVSGALALGISETAKVDSVSNLVSAWIKELTDVVSVASLVLGMFALVSGNWPVGIGLLVTGAIELGVSKGYSTESVTDWLRSFVTDLVGVVSVASLFLGVINMIAGNLPLGIGLLVLGSAGLAGDAAYNWDRIQTLMEGPLGELTAKISAASLVLGFVCVVAGALPLGIGLIVAGAAGLAMSLPAIWDNLNNYMQGPVAELTAKLSAASLILGFVCMAAGMVMLGVGLIVAGSAGLAMSLPAVWDQLENYMKGPVGELTAKLSAASLILGFVCVAAGWLALGVGLIVMGAGGLAASLPANWDRLKNEMEGPIGRLTAILTSAFLILGIVAIATGNVLLGLGLLAAGASGIIVSGSVNWDNFKQLGIDAKNMVKEGWDSIVLSLQASIETKWNNTVSDFKSNPGRFLFGDFWDWLFPSAKAESNYTYQVKVDAVPGYGFENSSNGIKLSSIQTEPIKLDVELWKKNWTTVVEWAYQQGHIQYDQYVALNKYNWTTVEKWVEKFKGWNVFQNVGLAKLGWTVISEWAKKSAGGAVSALVSLAKNGWSSVSNFVNGNKGGTVYQGIDLFVNNWSGFLTGVSKTLKSWFPQIFGNAEGGAIDAYGRVSRFAGGGSIVNGKINAYAGGTTNAHGSLFLAGEAGPEILGHIGGRTEVLNKSQLAATMYAAVQAAMAPAAAGFASAAAYLYEGANQYDKEDLATLMELVRAGSNAVQRQNDLLRQQNDYLRQINDKDWTPDVSTASINRAQMRMNRRAGTTIVPVESPI